MVLCDEAYFDIRYAGTSTSLASLPGMAERCLLLYTFSKKFAMTGWRLGAAIGPRDMIAVIAKLNVNDESCPNHFIQYGALEGLTGDQSGPRHIVEVLRERRDAAVALLNAMPGVRCAAPNATFYLFPNVTAALRARGLDDVEEFRRLCCTRPASRCARACTSAACSPASASTTCASPTRVSTRRRSSRGSGASRHGSRRARRVSAVDELKRTALYDRHVAAGGRMVDFAGWEMPLQYAGGIVAEHLATRKQAGLFDVSHMGRFVVGGPEALPFLQHVLTNNAAGLDAGRRSTRSSPTRPAAPSTTPTSTASPPTSTCSW